MTEMVWVKTKHFAQGKIEYLVHDCNNLYLLHTAARGGALGRDAEFMSLPSS